MNNTTNTIPEGTPGNGQSNNQQVNNQQQNNQERTFSQDEVNDIVRNRLAKERDRMAKLFQEEKQISELDEREQNIIKRELELKAKEELEKNNLPKRLSRLLDYSSEEALGKSFEEVKGIFVEALGERIRPFARQEIPSEGVGTYKPGPDPIRDAFNL